MIIDTMIRRRASLNESVTELNSNIVTRLAALPNFWNEQKTANDAEFSKGDESATLDLRQSLTPGLKGQIVYAPRFQGYLSRDIAQSDDFLALRVNTERADYGIFASQTFPDLIAIFGAYRAAIETDREIATTDWEIVCRQSPETDRDIDGRDSVFRIWPVNFFDGLLCERSFGMTAEQIVRRASAVCERAELLNGGAFLLVTANLLVGKALDELNMRVMSHLKDGGS